MSVSLSNNPARSIAPSMHVLARALPRLNRAYPLPTEARAQAYQHYAPARAAIAVFALGAAAVPVYARAPVARR